MKFGACMRSGEYSMASFECSHRKGQRLHCIGKMSVAVRGVALMQNWALTMRESPSLDSAVETGNEEVTALWELLLYSLSTLRTEVGHAFLPVTLKRDGKI